LFLFFAKTPHLLPVFGATDWRFCRHQQQDKMERQRCKREAEDRTVPSRCSKPSGCSCWSHIYDNLCVECRLVVGPGGIDSRGDIRTHKDLIVDGALNVGPGGVESAGPIVAEGGAKIGGPVEVGAGGISSVGSISTDADMTVAGSMAVGGGVRSRGVVTAPYFTMTDAPQPTSILPSPDSAVPLQLVTPPAQGPHGVLSGMVAYGGSETHWYAIAPTTPLDSAGPTVVLDSVDSERELAPDEIVDVAAGAGPGDTVARMLVFGGGGGGCIGDGAGGGGGGVLSFTGSVEGWRGIRAQMVQQGRAGSAGGFASGNEVAGGVGGATVVRLYGVGDSAVPSLCAANGGGGGAGAVSSAELTGSSGGGGAGYSQCGQVGKRQPNRSGGTGGAGQGAMPSGADGGFYTAVDGIDGEGVIAWLGPHIDAYFAPGAGGGGTDDDAGLAGKGGDVRFVDATGDLAISLGGVGWGPRGGGGASAGRGGGIVVPPSRGGGGAAGSAGAPGGVVLQYGN
jgi:hypothetical protein